MYSIQELSFILYNNRSLNGVIKNFLPNINPFILNKIENLLDKSKNKFISEEKMVEFNIKEIDSNATDVFVTKEDILNLTKKIKKNIGNLNENESKYLEIRNISKEIIKKWNLLGVSSIKGYRNLEIVGATCHPILRPILDDGIENGGIIIPLFENKLLVNCAIRRINSSKSLKYTLACPDISVWGLDDISIGDEIWITEGIFDMIALREMGKKAVSCSSAMWSGIQLYSVLDKKPSIINIFSDNDEVGLKTSAILQDFFFQFKINSIIWRSEIAKDAAEHFFEKNGDFLNLVQLNNIENIIEKSKDNSFDFLKHLKYRKF